MTVERIEIAAMMMSGLMAHHDPGVLVPPAKLRAAARFAIQVADAFIAEYDQQATTAQKDQDHG